MNKFILGKKLGMTTLYDKERGALNVTLIECEPNTVSMVRSEEKDGYPALQLEIVKTKNKMHRKEFRLEKDAEAESEKPKDSRAWSRDMGSKAHPRVMDTSMIFGHRDQLELSNRSMLLRARKWPDAWEEKE
jgi:ribosomal protein L3